MTAAVVIDVGNVGPGSLSIFGSGLNMPALGATVEWMVGRLAAKQS